MLMQKVESVNLGAVLLKYGMELVKPSKGVLKCSKGLGVLHIMPSNIAEL
jgi:hypothetical protein